jgi:hypothetical protein
VTLVFFTTAPTACHTAMSNASIASSTSCPVTYPSGFGTASNSFSNALFSFSQSVDRQSHCSSFTFTGGTRLITLITWKWSVVPGTRAGYALHETKKGRKFSLQNTLSGRVRFCVRFAYSVGTPCGNGIFILCCPSN